MNKIQEDYLRKDLIKALRKKQKDICFFCPKPIPNGKKLHHIIPDRLGGKLNKKNCILLCSKCHNKQDRINEKWEQFASGKDGEE